MAEYGNCSLRVPTVLANQVRAILARADGAASTETTVNCGTGIVLNFDGIAWARLECVENGALEKAGIPYDFHADAGDEIEEVDKSLRFVDGEAVHTSNDDTSPFTLSELAKYVEQDRMQDLANDIRAAVEQTRAASWSSQSDYIDLLRKQLT